MTKTESEEREAISGRIEGYGSYAAERGNHFKHLGRKWHGAHLILGWLAAALAGIAGVSLVADSKLLTASLAITSALVSAANAALNPGKKSHRAYEVAFVYLHVESQAKDFVATRLDYARLDEVRDELTTIRVAVEKADQHAVETHDS